MTTPTPTSPARILATWHTAASLRIAARKLRDEAVKGQTLVDPGQLLRLAKTCQEAASLRHEMDLKEKEEAEEIRRGREGWEKFHAHQEALEALESLPEQVRVEFSA